MPARRWPRRRPLRPDARRALWTAGLVWLLVMALAIAAAAGVVLRSMVTEYAASAAKDAVVTAVNDIVKDVLSEPAYSGSGLVELERDASGRITAVQADVVAVNSLAAEVLSRTVEQTAQEELTVSIPVANLLGSTLFMNRGPSIPVQVTMLSSSTASFRSELTGAGINQTRHQIFLELNVQLSFLLPWRDMDTSVQTEILVSETVIVGQVPASYMNWENENGTDGRVIQPVGREAAGAVRGLLR